MRSLLFFLVIPFLNAKAAPMDCSRLKTLAFELEKKIQTKNFGADCDKMDNKVLGLPDGWVGFKSDYDYRCKDYSAIELQLKSIENEIALLNGISALKDEIKSGKETLVKFSDRPEAAKDASNKLMANLQIAYSLELFLASNNEKGENILSKIVQDKNGWDSLSSFNGLVKKYCKEFRVKGASVCHKDFVLTEEVYNEINNFSSIGKKTNKKFNKKHVEELSDALTIAPVKVEIDGIVQEKEVNYADLLLEIKEIGKDGLLSKTDMEKVKAWPDFSRSKKFDFIKNLKDARKELKDTEALVAVGDIPARYATFMNDLKRRQEWDHKSKLSLILHQYGSAIPKEATDACEKARNLLGKVEDCLDPLIKAPALVKINAQAPAIISDLKAELAIGEKHTKKLTEAAEKCIPDSSLNLPTGCEGLITTTLADLEAKSLYLNALKAKFLKESSTLVSMRNFAMEKLHTGKCMTAEQTNITGCEADLGPISAQAVALSGAAQDILFVLQNPEEENPIDEICDESEEKGLHIEELCKLRDENAKDKPKKDESFEAPVETDFQRNNNGDAWGQALMNIGQAFGNYFNAQQPMINPYASMYPVTQPMVAPMDISTKIMAPAIMSGYGSYSPSPGLAPYGGGYAAGYGFSTSSYFNYSVGY